MSGDAIGMMEGAFFVSKGVILDWMNELLDVSYNPFNFTQCFSCNYQKLSSVQQDQFFAKLLMQFTQTLSMSLK